MFKTKRKLELEKVKVENRNKLIDKQFDRMVELKQENLAVHEENKDLRCEIEELQEFKKKVVSIMNMKATIVDKNDKLKELVDNLQTEN